MHWFRANRTLPTHGAIRCLIFMFDILYFLDVYRELFNWVKPHGGYTPESCISDDDIFKHIMTGVKFKHWSQSSKPFPHLPQALVEIARFLVCLAFCSITRRIYNDRNFLKKICLCISLPRALVIIQHFSFSSVLTLEMNERSLCSRAGVQAEMCMYECVCVCVCVCCFV